VPVVVVRGLDGILQTKEDKILVVFKLGQGVEGRD
jgi:hypothetical protein